MGEIDHKNQCDLVVIGAGAAGLAGAIFAAEALSGTASRVVLLDGATTIGAKILVSGGGRCNVTHCEVRPEDFHGPRVLIRNVLAAFPVQATIDWFASLGVQLKKEETGKLFPVTDRSRTVLNALVRRCQDLNVSILAGHRVIEATVIPLDRATEPTFLVRHQRGTVRARYVMLATGGRSLPRSGSDGSGWAIARSFGHSVTRTAPALVPLVLEDTFVHAILSGVSMTVELLVLVNGHLIDRRTGSLLWTHFGISGPVVMDASRFYSLANQAGHAVEVRCNFVPGSDAQTVDRDLVRRIGASPHLSVKKLLTAYVTERTAETFCTLCNLDPGTPSGQLTRDRRTALVRSLTALTLPVVRDRGWNYAEVTAGGIPLAEVNFRTMESKLVPGLYLVGEMLDCDGRIGGFNFQWGWATGFIAGRAVAAALTGRKRQ
jgi:predicted Rossmann fold flavoprotein